MKQLTIFVLILLLIPACSDSSSSGSDSESLEVAPVIPDVSTALFTINYFKGKTASEVSGVSNENFQLAAALVTSIETLMLGFSTLPDSFMESASDEDPSLTSGLWRWEYLASEGDIRVTVVLTAEIRTEDVEWTMFISAATPEFEFDGYKFMDGTIKNLENEGVWNFYSFDEESSTPALTYSWDIESEDDAEYLLTFGASDFSTVSYRIADANNTVVITSANQEESTIYWNSANGTGYYELSEGSRVCWDESRNNVECT